MQCIISNEMMSTVYSTIGQAPNGNSISASQAAQMEAQAPGALKNFYKFIQTVAEQPVKNIAELMTRAYYEARFREGTLIRAYVTVQGWLRDGTSLWRCGDDVWVTSPMAMLDMAMKIQTLTFQQDIQTGTTTVLELVLPWMLGDKPFGTGVQDQGPDVPQAPGPATSSN
jgi:prophage tail gpP-like protein